MTVARNLCDDAGYRLTTDGTPGRLICDHVPRQPGGLARARATTGRTAE